MQASKQLVPLGRLKKRAEFLRVREGRIWHARSFVLQARRKPVGCLRDGKPDQELARFGFTATKRLGNAVTRNRARRRLKELVRQAANAHVRAGYDYVVIARNGALTQSFEHIAKELCEAIEGIHRQKPARV